MNYPRIKICCISSLKEADLAIKYGADAIGLVSEMPSGPGVISEKKISEIALKVPPPIATFLLTSSTNATDIIRQLKACNTNTIQLVDSVPPEVYPELRKYLPGIKLVQVIHVTDEHSVTEAIKASNYVDAVLLDSGNQKLKIKQLGGTGRTHDWSLSKKIVDNAKVPVFLAGGLNPSNVAEAVKTVMPFGLDICSGVRENGKLSERLLKEFFKQLQKSV